jgi:NitT/TauT family transport system ATP-binding protein
LRGELAALVDRRRVTTLLVTHDIEEAARLADRVFVLSARPARMLAELPIEMPRRRRSEQDLEAIKGKIAASSTARS